jgi:hypothetical protein
MEKYCRSGVGCAALAAALGVSSLWMAGCGNPSARRVDFVPVGAAIVPAPAGTNPNEPAKAEPAAKPAAAAEHPAGAAAPEKPRAAAEWREAAFRVALTGHGTVLPAKGGAERQAFHLHLAVANPSGKPLILNPAAAFLLDDEGQRVVGAELMQDGRPQQTLTVAPHETGGGVLAFEMPAAARFESIGSLRFYWPCEYGDEVCEVVAKFVRPSKVNHITPGLFQPRPRPQEPLLFPVWGAPGHLAPYPESPQGLSSDGYPYGYLYGPGWQGYEPFLGPSPAYGGGGYGYPYGWGGWADGGWRHWDDRGGAKGRR